MNISFMLIFVVHLPYSTHYSFLMKYENKNVFIQYISNVALVIFLFTVFVIFALNYASVSFEKNALPLFPLLEMSGSDSVSYQPQQRQTVFNE